MQRDILVVVFGEKKITKYVTPKEAAAQLGVHFRTLVRWEKEGKIQAIKTPSGQRRYDVQSYTVGAESIRATVLYARVSSRAQQPDLNRQVAALATLYPDAEVIAEIGGGLNFKRKKLQALLVRVMQGSVRRIIVAHKDRFARFGFDHFKWLCEQHGCEIVVLNETALSPERELTEDVRREVVRLMEFIPQEQRSRLLQEILSSCSHVKESQTLPMSKVSNEIGIMQGTKAQHTSSLKKGMRARESPKRVNESESPQAPL